MIKDNNEIAEAMAPLCEQCEIRPLIPLYDRSSIEMWNVFSDIMGSITPEMHELFRFEPRSFETYIFDCVKRELDKSERKQKEMEDAIYSAALMLDILIFLKEYIEYIKRIREKSYKKFNLK